MKPIFRSAMFGFHKGDVFHFITKQNKQFSDLSAELEQQREEFEREKEAFVHDTEELKALRASLQKSKKSQSEIQEKFSEIMLLQSKISADLKLLCLEQDAEKEVFDRLVRRVAEAEALREKAEKFDRLSGVLSSIFNQNAESEISASTSEANVVEETFAEHKSIAGLLVSVQRLSEQCSALEMFLKENEDA